MESSKKRDGADWHDLQPLIEVEFDAIAERYAEPHRAYHNLRHISAMFDLLAERPFTVERPALLTLAIWYHDAVYDPRASNNEEASAALFSEFADRNSLPRETVEWVCALIVATKHHSPDTNDQSVLVDLDIAILGASAAEFDAYDSAIRREYSHVPDVAYRDGRIRVLRSFLDRPQIFNTSVMQSFEQPARANIARATERLSLGRDI